MSKSIHIGKEITEFLVNADLRRYKIQKNKLKKRVFGRMIRISVNQSAKSRNGKEKLQGEKKIAAMAITREEENKTR